MFNVYKNEQSQLTGSRNLMGPKTLPTIWEKCDEKYLRRMDRRTEVKQYTPPPPSGKRGYKNEIIEINEK
jgi:hypothetical protein